MAVSHGCKYGVQDQESQGKYETEERELVQE